MRFPSTTRFAIGGNALLAVLLLFGAPAAPAHAQRVPLQTRNPSAAKPSLPPSPVQRPLPLPPPPVAPVRPITAAPAQRQPGVPLAPIRYGSPTVPVVQPITGAPAGQPAGIQPIRLPGVFAIGRKFPAMGRPIETVGAAQPQLPPATRRLLLSAPPAPTLVPAAPPVPRVRPLLTHFSGIAQLPPDAKVYCSPDSILYNTGAICFNPDTETINPEFYPWGLFAPPPQLTPHGFISLFPVGLLIQPCPQCALAAAGLIPSRSPFDRWWYLTSGLARFPSFHRFTVPAQPAPPSSAVRSTKSSGPAVVLVLRSGTRVLVSRYWLGQDWMLHFITVTGSRRAVGLNQLNLQATGAANYDRGVTFVLPGWPEPQPNH